MKNIRFQSLTLLSYKEKKARKINLDSKIVWIKGGNETGKSCILKSIYKTLGGGIKLVNPKWADANVVLLLEFSIDTVGFKALQMGYDLYIFNPDNSLRFKVNTLQAKDNKKLNIFFGIDNPALPHITPSAMYMPFYIDQDSGWSDVWSSFSKCGSNKEKANIRQYLTNYVDDAYFIKKNELTNVESELKRVVFELKTYKHIINEVKAKYKKIDVNTSIDEFKDNVDSYLKKLKDLRESQKSIIRELQNLYTKKTYYELTIAQLQHNVNEMEKDFNYAISLDDVIACPTCGCRYSNSMLDRHEIVEDIHECKDMIISYKKELDKTLLLIEKTSENSDKMNQQIADIQASIKVSQNNISLEELIDSRVRERIVEIVAIKELDYRKEQGKLFGNKLDLEEIIKNYEHSDRKTEIEEYFKKQVISALKYMNVTVLPKIRFGGRVTATGSTLPVAIVAYTFAYLLVMIKYNAPLFFPIVIDEPKEKGLKNSGLQLMVDYMISNLPETGQLILSSANDYLKVENALVLDLDKTPRLLIDEDFPSASSIIDELLDKTLFR